MTFASFHVAFEGYVAAHSPPNATEPTDEEYLAVLAEEQAAGRA